MWTGTPSLIEMLAMSVVVLPPPIITTCGHANGGSGIYDTQLMCPCRPVGRLCDVTNSGQTSSPYSRAFGCQR
eukprot:4230015-Prymnesium_polylepis.1